MSAFKKFCSTVVQEIKEANTLLRRAGVLPHDKNLENNFRRYGPSMDAENYAQFVEIAQNLYDEGIKSTDPLYTVIKIDYKRVAVDYNGEKRGIYSEKGTPLAFFRPDFHELGYANREEELQAFKNKESFQLKKNRLYVTGEV